MLTNALNRYATRYVFLGIFALGITPACLGQLVSGQGAVEVRFYSQYYGRYVSRYSAGTLTVEKSDSPRNEDGHWEGTSTAQVSDLDLENVTVQEGCCDAFGLTSKQGFGFMIVCNGGEFSRGSTPKCVSEVGRFTIPDRSLGSGSGRATNLVVSCGTRDECSNFLDALKGRQKPVAPAQSSQIKSAEEASTYSSVSGRSSRSSKDKPADEPVIDGSRIPSQITFEKPGTSGSKREVRDAPKPIFDQLGREYLGSNNTASNSAGTEKLTSLFDSLAKQPPDILTSQDKKRSPVEFYTPEVEKYGAGLFDDARKGRLENFADPLRSAARGWFTERYEEMARNNASRLLTGQSFDELPEGFRKDYSVWEAGFKRIFEPFSLKGGLKFVDAFGSLFDLWKEP